MHNKPCFCKNYLVFVLDCMAWVGEVGRAGKSCFSIDSLSMALRPINFELGWVLRWALGLTERNCCWRKIWFTTEPCSNSIESTAVYYTI